MPCEKDIFLVKRFPVGYFVEKVNNSGTDILNVVYPKYRLFFGKLLYTYVYVKANSNKEAYEIGVPLLDNDKQTQLEMLFLALESEVNYAGRFIFNNTMFDIICKIKDRLRRDGILK